MLNVANKQSQLGGRIWRFVNMSNTPLEVSSKDESKTVTIIVNGRQKTVPKNEDITFEAFVALAFDTPPTGDGVQFTVQFTRGQGNKPAGTLIEGQSVKVKDG